MKNRSEEQLINFLSTDELIDRLIGSVLTCSTERVKKKEFNYK